MTQLYPKTIRPVLLTLLLLVVSAPALIAQVTFTGSFTFTTQAEIDAFTDPGGNKYTDVTGSLTLDPAAGEIFTGYDNFSDITTIGGGFVVNNYNSNQTLGNPLSGFTQLSSLASLTIEGTLVGTGNSGVTEITRRGLSAVTGAVRIINNSALTEVDLRDISALTGDLELRGNQALTDTDFGDLLSIGGRFIFANNDAVVNLFGFEDLETIGTDLFIVDNDVLSFLNQLTANNKIFTTLDTLQIENNPNLGSLGNGVGSGSFLQVTVNGAFILRSNIALSEVGQEINLASNNSGSPLSDIQIVNNTQLNSINEIFSGNATIFTEDFQLDRMDNLFGAPGQPINVSGDLSVTDNDFLRRLPNFNSTTSLASLTISDNPGLRQTTRLNALTTVAGAIEFVNNDALSPTSSINAPAGGPGFTFLNNLTSAGSLLINGNASITTLDQLGGNVAQLTIASFLTITNNGDLGDCCQPTCKTTVNGQQFDGANSAVTVSGNTGDCADKPAVVAACSGEPGKACLAAAPVDFIAFTGDLRSNHVALEWATASETENDYFQVERSTDGYTFEAIAKINGAGDSQQELGYSFDDYEYASGINYYRLRQVDYDGTEDFSDVISVDAGEASLALGMYPNPSSTGEVSFRLSRDWNEERVSVEIFNASGQLVHRTLNPRQGIITDELTPGMYAVRVSDGTHSVTERLLIQ